MNSLLFLNLPPSQSSDQVATIIILNPIPQDLAPSETSAWLSAQLLQRHGVSGCLRHGCDDLLVLRGAADEAHDDVLALGALQAAVGAAMEKPRVMGYSSLQQVTQHWQGLSIGRLKWPAERARCPPRWTLSESQHLCLLPTCTTQMGSVPMACAASS